MKKPLSPSVKNSSRRRVIRMNKTCEITSLGPSRTYQLIAAGLFPAPFQIVPGGRAMGWWEDEIYAWLETRASASKGDTK